MQSRTYLAIAAWTVLAVAVAQNTAPKRVFKRMRPETAEQRINELQTGLQEALNDLTMTKMHKVEGIDANGKPSMVMMPAEFGVRRTPPAVIQHDHVDRTANVAMTVAVENAELNYYMVSRLGKPLSPSKMTFHKNFGMGVYTLPPSKVFSIMALADRACPTIAKTGSFKGNVGGDIAEVRPLRLSKPECLSCHRDSKIGDPLALLVVVQEKFPPAAKGAASGPKR